MKERSVCHMIYQNLLVIGISSRALFNLEEENKIFEQQGVNAYEEYQIQHQKENTYTPMGKDPFANFLTNLSRVQELFMDSGVQPIRTALITSRNVPAHERAIKTLQN